MFVYIPTASDFLHVGSMLDGFVIHWMDACGKGLIYPISQVEGRHLEACITPMPAQGNSSPPQDSVPTPLAIKPEDLLNEQRSRWAPSLDSDGRSMRFQRFLSTLASGAADVTATLSPQSQVPPQQRAGLRCPSIRLRILRTPSTRHLLAASSTSHCEDSSSLTVNHQSQVFRDTVCD